MDFQQVNTFYHVARRLNFTRAAEDLNLSQPAVSRQIEALEHTLGVPLFHRSHRSISLTEAGMILFRQCEQILTLVDHTKSAIESLKNLESGSLSIGLSSTVGNYVLPSTILEFIQKYPGIQTSIEIDCTQKVLHSAEQRTTDIVVIAGPVESSVLYMEPFLQDEIVLAISNDHPLAKNGQITLNSLLEYPLLLRRDGSHSRQTMLDHFRQIRWNPSHIIELDTTEAIKQALMAGVGIAFMSKYAVRFETDCGLIQTIDQAPFNISRSFFIATHKSRTPSTAMLAFKSFIKKNCLSHPVCSVAK